MTAPPPLAPHQPARPPLAPYACRPEDSRGRLCPEPDSPTRSCFQRDRDRIVHSVAFRRLKHKTQVFVYHEGDHYRTRLTHSIEVAQIARSIGRVLGLDEDLAEALALAHDLGHTPFGHAGQDALGAVMAPFGGFDHNEQTFRILTRLERRYAEFDGLNLTWETLEGTAKHNGPLIGGSVPPTIAAFCRDFDLELDSHPGAEAQVAALADDIAYNNHDIDDGLRAGLFTVADLDPLPLVGPVFREVAERYPGLEEQRLIHEAVRRLIDRMVNDLLAETRRRIAEAAPKSAADLRALGAPVVAFSEPMRENDRALKDFLFRHMYRHERVNRMTAKAREVVRDLFALYMEAPRHLPAEWRAGAQGAEEAGTARLVADYIAGMTDRFALAEHRKLFGSETKL
ncbi:MAG: deoxyguanosinetriphosphate triphosphohydrolase [Proteobacteria bacterium]|nr:deoxyguanosinetriphosphate triphosphohydrolase [Pseudomonadota bacterium]